MDTLPRNMQRPVNDIVTSWDFRGHEYTVSLSIIDSPLSMSILISDNETGEEWLCTHDQNYVEDLTRRTGSFKPFQVFVTMLRGAILKTTNSVIVELHSLDDLRQLRNQRHRRGLVAVNEFGGGPRVQPGNLFARMEVEGADVQEVLRDATDVRSAPLQVPMEGQQQQNSSEDRNKRFLIVTYMTEFDSINYPIPLVYSGSPDPVRMHNYIRRLKSENERLRSTNTDLQVQLDSNIGIGIGIVPMNVGQSHSRGDLDLNSNEAISEGVRVRALLRDREQLEIDSRTLLNRIRSLEDQLSNVEQNFQSMTKELKLENNLLVQIIYELEESQGRLRKKIEDQKKDREHFQRTAGAATATSSASSSSNHRRNTCYNLGPPSYKGTDKQKSTTSSLRVERSRSTTTSSSRSSSLNSQRSSTSREGRVSAMLRKESSSPRRIQNSARTKILSFNPTVYIQEKRVKEEETRIKRLQEIGIGIAARKANKLKSDTSSLHGERRLNELLSSRNRKNNRENSPRRSRHRSRQPRGLPPVQSGAEARTSSTIRQFLSPKATNLSFEPGRHTKLRMEERRRSKSRERETDEEGMQKLSVHSKSRTRSHSHSSESDKGRGSQGGGVLHSTYSNTRLQTSNTELIRNLAEDIEIPRPPSPALIGHTAASLSNIAANNGNEETEQNRQKKGSRDDIEPALTQYRDFDTNDESGVRPHNAGTQSEMMAITTNGLFANSQITEYLNRIPYHSFSSRSRPSEPTALSFGNGRAPAPMNDAPK